MIPIVTSEQMRSIDENAIKGNVTIGYSYMLKAGIGIRNYVCENVTNPQSGEIAVICGKGNNGGDGYVAARLLCEEGYQVMCFSLFDTDELVGESKIAYKEYVDSKGNILVVTDIAELADLKRFILIIDAILGTGLQGNPRGHYADVIDKVNRSGVPVLSVDIPSGLDANNGIPGSPTILASSTITMGFPKTGFYFFPGRLHCGKLIIQDLNYPDDCIADKRTTLIPELSDLKRKLPARHPAGSKYEHGLALLICGSRGYTGSAVLACEAAFRTGCGMVHLCTPESIVPIVSSKLTETVIHPLFETNTGTIARSAIEQILKYAKNKSALCLGPGLSHEPETLELITEIVRTIDIPIVLDADGINAFKGAGRELRKHKGELVITPHRGEWTRVFGPLPEKPTEVISHLRKTSMDLQCTILLKGNPTLVAEPGGLIYILPFGNSALAKAGSGDVLSGIIVSLVAQGASVTDAAILGAYIQGEAAIYSSNVLSEYSVMATDVISSIYKVIKTLAN